MSEELFDLIFRGEVVKNVDVGQARKNVQQLFKIPAAKVDALFSGKPVVLKRGLTMDVANKYRVAIKKAGALVNVVAQDNPIQQGASQEKFANTASASTNDPQAGFTIAPVGADVLNVGEREAVLEKTFDLSEFSVRENDGPLLDADETLNEVSLGIDVDWSIAPAGSELLTEDQKEHSDPVTLDLSGLSLDEVGVTLVEPKKDTVRAPDVSHLSLED